LNPSLSGRFLLGEVAGTAAAGATKAKVIASSWTFGAILSSAVLIMWGAEAAQFFIAQGLALAILAWLQTLPEFAVEAVIAYEAGRDPASLHLVTANFTGSLRLFVGLNWPMIYFVHAFSSWRRKGARRLPEIRMGGDDPATIFFLYPALAYFSLIWWKGTLSILDGFALVAIYAAYLAVLQFLPPQELEEESDVGRIPRAIIHMRRGPRIASILSLFLSGGLILYFCAEPFLHSLKELALTLGISTFIFIQWVAPFVSEFPEKVTACYWARKAKSAPMALMNVVSSSFSQWTVLTGIIPFVYSYSAGRISTVVFDDQQRVEILLTIVQSLLGALLLSNLSFKWWEAVVLFVLWFAQFLVPTIHGQIIWVYAAWVAVEILKLVRDRKHFAVFPAFHQLFRRHVLGRS